MVCSSSGDVYAWGANTWGQLGLGDDVSRTSPVLVEDCALESCIVVQVACGARHTAVLTDGGHVFSWGWNKYGTVTGAVGGEQCVLVPTRLKVGRVRCIAAGGWHTQLLVDL